MAILHVWQGKPALVGKDMAEYQDFWTMRKKIYAITEKGYFEKGLDTTKEILKYHGVIKALKGFDYFCDA